MQPPVVRATLMMEGDATVYADSESDAASRTLARDGPRVARNDGKHRAAMLTGIVLVKDTAEPHDKSVAIEERDHFNNHADLNGGIVISGKDKKGNPRIVGPSSAIHPRATRKRDKYRNVFAGAAKRDAQQGTNESSDDERLAIDSGDAREWAKDTSPRRQPPTVLDELAAKPETVLPCCERAARAIAWYLGRDERRRQRAAHPAGFDRSIVFHRPAVARTVHWRT
jgi:hypothetical protein